MAGELSDAPPFESVTSRDTSRFHVFAAPNDELPARMAGELRDAPPFESVTSRDTSRFHASAAPDDELPARMSVVTDVIYEPIRDHV